MRYLIAAIIAIGVYTACRTPGSGTTARLLDDSPVAAPAAPLSEAQLVALIDVITD